MTRESRTVGIVEDDASLRGALARLLLSAGYGSHAFGSVEEVMSSSLENPPACFVADIRLPGRTGLELPAVLADRSWRAPVIFMTAYDTLESRTAAKKAGAAGYFRKPVDDQALLDAIDWALARNGIEETDDEERRGENE